MDASGPTARHSTAPTKKINFVINPRFCKHKNYTWSVFFVGGCHGISSLFHRKKSAKVVDAWTPIRHSNQPFDPTQNPSLHVVQTEHLPQPGKQSEWMIRSSKVTWKAEFNYTFEDEHISSKLRMVHLPLIPNRCIGLATSHLTFKTIPL